MLSTIERRVYINPKYLNSDINQHIFDEVSRTSLNECTKKYGHILSIKHIIDIVNIEDTIFKVKFEAETLKPEPKNIFTGVVCMVYKDGIFVNICNKQKMLIPSITIKGYVFDEVNSEYVNGKKRIKEGDKIKIMVTASKYNNKNFSCVGSLV